MAFVEDLQLVLATSKPSPFRSRRDCRHGAGTEGLGQAAIGRCLKSHTLFRKTDLYVTLFRLAWTTFWVKKTVLLVTGKFAQWTIAPTMWSGCASTRRSWPLQNEPCGVWSLEMLGSAGFAGSHLTLHFVGETLWIFGWSDYKELLHPAKLWLWCFMVLSKVLPGLGHANNLSLSQNLVMGEIILRWCTMTWWKHAKTRLSLKYIAVYPYVSRL